MSTDTNGTSPSGGVVVTDTVETTDTVEIVTEESAVVFLNGGVQGPPGSKVEMRRQGVSGVIEWRHEDDDVWQNLIDLADGVVAVKPVPPKFIVDATTVTNDPALASVSVTQPDDLEGTYHLGFVLPRGPQGIPGKDGQPKFSGEGPPDEANYPSAVDGDLYWDRLDGRIYTFHSGATTPGSGGTGTGTSGTDTPAGT